MIKIELDRIRVLVADPSPHMVSIIRAMLRGFGITDVREANDSKVALAALMSRQVDAMIVEDRLSPHDGTALTRQLRACAECPNRDIPVIMMSGQAEMSRIIHARDAGVTEFLKKPLSAAVLRDRLLAAFAQPRTFVDGPAYAGPDRRRRTLQIEGDDRRGPADAATRLSGTD